MSSFTRCKFSKNWSLILCLNLFEISSILHSFGKLFQTFGPMYEILFWPIFVDLNGCFILYSDLRVVRGFSIREYISDMYAGPNPLQNLNALTETHCSYLFCTGSQFIVLNSFTPIWDWLSSPRQKRIHLFCAICSFFVRFLFRFEYHAEQA